MKIEAGKYYRTRDGQKVGPMRPSDYTGNEPFVWSTPSGGLWAHNGEDGEAFGRIGTKTPGDIIAEWSGPVDLTAITTPFGLLDAATQQALRDHGGPYEFYTRNGWEECRPAWVNVAVYRVKPKPATREEVLYWQYGEPGTRNRYDLDTHKITITLEGDTPTAIAITPLR